MEPLSNWHNLFPSELARLDQSNLLRQRRVVRPLDGMLVEVDGDRRVNFASNDYLGLARHPRIAAAMMRAIQSHGNGSAAAPLITGRTDLHAHAEEVIARWKGTEAAVLFSSGFQANLGLIDALAATAESAGLRARFLLDKLAHASLVDAVRSSPDSFRVFPHNGIAKLSRLLEERDERSLDVIVTESIFSMDGDRADLQSIASLRRQHGALVVVDEAHGSGVYGDGGSGLCAELGLSADIDATVVTLSKAVGLIGAAVCGSRAMCDVIVNRARPYIYSTSMPAHIAAGAIEAISVMRDEPQRQARVRMLARQVRDELSAAGFEMPIGDSPILPIILGEETTALSAAARLAEVGLHVLPIRPPTVPRGSSRLRITLSAEHTDAQVEQLLAAVRRYR